MVICVLGIDLQSCVNSSKCDATENQKCKVENKALKPVCGKYCHQNRKSNLLAESQTLDCDETMLSSSIIKPILSGVLSNVEPDNILTVKKSEQCIYSNLSEQAKKITPAVTIKNVNNAKDSSCVEECDDRQKPIFSQNEEAELVGLSPPSLASTPAQQETQPGASDQVMYKGLVSSRGHQNEAKLSLDTQCLSSTVLAADKSDKKTFLQSISFSQIPDSPVFSNSNMQNGIEEFNDVPDSDQLDSCDKTTLKPDEMLNELADDFQHSNSIIMSSPVLFREDAASKGNIQFPDQSLKKNSKHSLVSRLGSPHENANMTESVVQPGDTSPSLLSLECRWTTSKLVQEEKTTSTLVGATTSNENQAETAPVKQSKLSLQKKFKSPNHSPGSPVFDHEESISSKDCWKSTADRKHPYKQKMRITDQSRSSMHLRSRETSNLTHQTSKMNRKRMEGEHNPIRKTKNFQKKMKQTTLTQDMFQELPLRKRKTTNEGEQESMNIERAMRESLQSSRQLIGKYNVHGNGF